MGCASSIAIKISPGYEEMTKGDIKEINGNYYLSINRCQQKLNKEIEKAFERVLKDGVRNEEQEGKLFKKSPAQKTHLEIPDRTSNDHEKVSSSNNQRYVEEVNTRKKPLLIDENVNYSSNNKHPYHQTKPESSKKVEEGKREETPPMCRHVSEKEKIAKNSSKKIDENSGILQSQGKKSSSKGIPSVKQSEKESLPHGFFSEGTGIDNPESANKNMIEFYRVDVMGKTEKNDMFESGEIVETELIHHDKRVSTIAVEGFPNEKTISKEYTNQVNKEIYELNQRALDNSISALERPTIMHLISANSSIFGMASDLL